MATDTLTTNRIDWNFSREFRQLDPKKCFACIIIGEDPAYRVHIADLLITYKNMDIIADAATVNGIPGNLDSGTPDLAFIKINIRGKNPIKTIRMLKKQYPGIIVLATANYTEPNIVRHIFMAGANGYIKDEFLDTNMDEAIHSLIAGKIYLTNNLFSSLLENILDDNGIPNRKEDSIAHLAEKEFDIFILLGCGYKNQEIACETDFSLSSVIAYIKNIRFRMGLSRTSELKSLAVSWVKRNVEIGNS